MQEFAVARQLVNVGPSLVEVVGATGAPFSVVFPCCPELASGRRTCRIAPPEDELSMKATWVPSPDRTGEPNKGEAGLAVLALYAHITLGPVGQSPPPPARVVPLQVKVG
jgi:hypothetical protein